MAALPKNKGLRLLEVNGVRYYWKVHHQDLDNRELVVIVGLEAKPNKRFEFRFIHVHWVDYIGTNEFDELSKVKNELNSVTPIHIRNAIILAEEENWKDSKGLIAVKLVNGEYLYNIK